MHKIGGVRVLFLGSKYHEEPLKNLKVRPQEEEYVFMVDPGTERSSLI